MGVFSLKKKCKQVLLNESLNDGLNPVFLVSTIFEMEIRKLEMFQRHMVSSMRIPHS